jgi:hypothetical protein
MTPTVATRTVFEAVSGHYMTGYTGPWLNQDIARLLFPIKRAALNGLETQYFIRRN